MEIESNQSAIEPLSALAHESRLAIFRLLVPEGPDGLTAGKIGERLDIPGNALSFHLTRLRYAGLVTVRRNGRERIYAAAYGEMRSLIGFLTENCCQRDPRGGSSDRPQPSSSETDERHGGRKVRNQYSLGKMFSYGFGVPKDLNRAFQWIEMAAKKDFDKAQYNLGKMYRDGLGVDDDPEASTRWFLRAAEQGYAKAQYRMGRRLAKGTGIAKDEVRALMWLTLAARQAHPRAIKTRKALAQKLSPEQRAQAKRLAPGRLGPAAAEPARRASPPIIKGVPG